MKAKGDLNKILVVQEILPSYRVPIFNELARLNNGSVTVLSSKTDLSFGKNNPNNMQFKHVETEWKKFLFKFKFSSTVFYERSKCDIVLHVADFKFISLWLMLIVNVFSPKRLFMHGQGGYKNNSILSSLIYSVTIALSNGYICYTDYSRNALLKKLPSILHKKVTVCENTLSVSPVSSINDFNTKSIFYIGRIRSGCNLEFLLEATRLAKLRIELIGAVNDEYRRKLELKYQGVVKFHGAVFTEERQKEIAKGCIAGVYGGDAGLSVVHYMSLGLPVIVHGQISKHMGPEPSYVENEVNGLIFERGNLNSLVEKMNMVANDKRLNIRLANAALKTFNNLSRPSMAEKFDRIISESK
ncbi:glycosyltransferase [Aliiglaciecola sp. SL4]|uniref:glycosyltransferase n=1 Tax=Aliiglaciecola sp. SL4 TaxID=3239806 RepID=UPI00355C4E29